MPSSNLQGLNIVHPAQEAGDSHDLLLGQAYPDLTAQLDLWTNLTFDSEDHDHRKATPKHIQNNDDDDDEAAPPVAQKPVPPVQPIDLGSLLASFGIDPFAHQQLQHQQPAIAPSLAQLLALHNPPFSSNQPLQFPQSAPHHSFPRNTSPLSANEDSYVPAKRARTRKASITTADSPDLADEGSPDASASGSTGPSNTTPLSAAEDKRRRNTAASARFRLKKKEREAALEGKAKELETKVLELERECEGLRRENGWLKGLVVGVTGAAQAPAAAGASIVAPPSQAAPVSAGSKRRRDEDTL